MSPPRYLNQVLDYSARIGGLRLTAHLVASSPIEDVALQARAVTLLGRLQSAFEMEVRVEEPHVRALAQSRHQRQGADLAESHAAPMARDPIPEPVGAAPVRDVESSAAAASAGPTLHVGGAVHHPDAEREGYVVDAGSTVRAPRPGAEGDSRTSLVVLGDAIGALGEALALCEQLQRDRLEALKAAEEAEAANRRLRLQVLRHVARN